MSQKGKLAPKNQLHVRLERKLAEFSPSGRHNRNLAGSGQALPMPSDDLQASDLELRNMLQILQENLTDLVVLHELDGCIVWASPSVYRQLGYTPDEFLGRQVFEMVHPEDAMGPLIRAYEDCMRKQGHMHVPNRVRRKDGSYLWVESVTSPVRDEFGRMVRVLAVSRDISHRRQAEQALRASENLYRTTFESAPLGMCHLLPEGILAWANNYFAELVGQPAEQLTGMEITGLIHPADRSDGDFVTWLLSGENGRQRLELRLRNQDGSPRWVEFTSLVVTNSSGGAEYLICMLQEIGMRKLAEERMMELCQEMERKLAAKSQALANAQRAMKEQDARLQKLEDDFQSLNRQFMGYLEAQGDGVWVVDLAGQINFANSRACQMSGYSLEELLGKNVALLAGEEFARRLPRPRQAPQDEAHTPHPATLIRKDGHKMPVLITASLLTDSEGNLKGMLARVHKSASPQAGHPF